MDDLILNCYRILGLQPGVSTEEVEESFKKIKAGLSAKEEEWERFKEVNWAYEILIKNFPVRENDKPLKKDKAIIETVNPFFFAGRVLVFLVALVWGFKYAANSMDSNYAGESFLHNISLPFHEAGHIIFSFLGNFMGVLGGSLLQVLIPAVCMGAFIRRKDLFSASVTLWWVGQNFIDIAPYIGDARAQELMLLGGVTGQDVPGIHDWNNILGTLGLLKFDHLIAYTAHYFGVLLMFASLLWGAYLLYLQWQRIER